MIPPLTFEISTDRSRIDVDFVHDFLSRSSYWAAGRPRSVVERSIQNSICFRVYHLNQQMGFARVITDRATFGYVADVFVIEEFRGRGLAKMLMEAIVAHPELQGLNVMMLVTCDVHELYARLGSRLCGIRMT